MTGLKEEKTMLRKNIFVAFALTFGLAVSIPASADPVCKAVHGRLDLAASAGPCSSPVLCATGVLHGALKAHSEFFGTSFVPTVYTAETGVVLLTGDNTLHTTDGDIFTKDSVVFNLTGDGEFAEVDTIVGGTGEYLGASGYLQATGTFANGVGVGAYVGKVCWQ